MHAKTRRNGNRRPRQLTSTIVIECMAKKPIAANGPTSKGVVVDVEITILAIACGQS